MFTPLSNGRSSGPLHYHRKVDEGGGYCCQKSLKQPPERSLPVARRACKKSQLCLAQLSHLWILAQPLTTPLAHSPVPNLLMQMTNKSNSRSAHFRSYNR